MMKRFVEDFNSDVHTINELADDPTRNAEIKVEEFDDSIDEMRKSKVGKAETASQAFERKYEEHEENQKRNNINLSVLMLPIVLAIYLSFKTANLDI
jgi:hypothetical protein